MNEIINANKANKEIEVYLDIIKIIAVWLVIFTHTGPMASKYYYEADNNQLLFISFDVIRAINVPLFFMVSGALLLGKQESITQIFKKRIFKYFTALLITSLFYYVVYLGNDWRDVKGFIIAFLEKPIIGPLWFMYEYLCYLLILPLLRCIAQRLPDKYYLYYFTLGVMAKGGFFILFSLLGLDSPYFPFSFSATACFYPLMGFYYGKRINKGELRRGKIMMGIIASFIATVICTIMTVQDEIVNGEWSETYEDAFATIMTVTAFCLIKYLCEKINFNELSKRVIHMIGNTVFGVYLISIYLQATLTYYWEKMLPYVPRYIAGLLYVTLIMCLGMVIVLLFNLSVIALKRFGQR